MDTHYVSKFTLDTNIQKGWIYNNLSIADALTLNPLLEQLND
jgi:hypothetical protein